MGVSWCGLGLLLLLACDRSPPVRDRGGAEPGRAATNDGEQRWTAMRELMVEEQLVTRGIRDPRVLAAMRKVPRHAFIPYHDARAYDDTPRPIGLGQTISQPYIVAIMTEVARLEPTSKVLEIGTGSGYQAAVLAEIAQDVYSIEIVDELAAHAARVLRELGYQRVHLRTGDGYRGWPEAAPFDAILVTAAPPAVPAPLVEQLAVGGRLVVPVGDLFQELRVLRRTDEGTTEETLFPVAFVPMIGEAQGGRDAK